MNILSKIFQKRPSKTPEEKEAKLEQELQQFLKITKDDSRKERRQKLKHSFDRNNVIMVSESTGGDYFDQQICRKPALSHTASHPTRHAASYQGRHFDGTKWRIERSGFVPRGIDSSTIGRTKINGSQLLHYLFGFVQKGRCGCVVVQPRLSTRLSSSLHCQISYQNPKESCGYAVSMLSTGIHGFESRKEAEKARSTPTSTNRPTYKMPIDVSVAFAIDH
jgi:hypothetical protein